jgi:predicted RNA-binding protein with EMAP domain
MIRPPGNKDVRFVKRQLTHLVNDGTAIEDEVDEVEVVLGHVMSVANEISGDIREITWIRHKIEFDVLHELKQDRTLWDGTRVAASAAASAAS